MNKDLSFIYENLKLKKKNIKLEQTDTNVLKGFIETKKENVGIMITIYDKRDFIENTVGYQLLIGGLAIDGSNLIDIKEVPNRIMDGIKSYEKMVV